MARLAVAAVSLVAALASSVVAMFWGLSLLLLALAGGLIFIATGLEPSPDLPGLLSFAALWTGVPALVAAAAWTAFALAAGRRI